MTISVFPAWQRRSYPGLRLGLFLHYVYFNPERGYEWGALGRHHDGPTTTLDALADGLDVEEVARAAEAMSAECVIFTAWHADMNVLYPSEVMARRRPGHAARRDVIADLLAALHAHGIELMLYVHPCDGHDFTEEDQAATGWLDGPPYARWHAFITEIFTELTHRYRGQLLGYWVDGGTPPQIDGGLDALRRTIRDIDPGLVVVQNEAFHDNRFRRWADEGAREFIADPFPTSDLQATAVITGNWWADGSYLQWTPELAYRYLVLQSATAGMRGGTVFSTGPYTGGVWEPGVREFFATLGGYVRAVAPTLLGTQPGRAYVTPPGATLAGMPKWAATESADGRTTYLHLLHVPVQRTLALPAPADGRRFTGAVLWRTGQAVALRQDAEGVHLTLPDTAWWHPQDTVIALTS